MTPPTTDLSIRTQAQAGRITLTRPKALNAMSHRMGLDIEAALDAWEHDDAVRIVLIDAEGDKAFCAGGDIQKIYHEGRTGTFGPTRQFWRDEYRLNARISTYPKPIITFLQGFTMGGGVGLGCHAAHRIVCESSRIAMPECGIGLVPDAGGSFLLARAPGRLGEYLGVTGHRMGPACAIHAGFADHFVPETQWLALKTALCAEAAPSAVASAAADAGQSPLIARAKAIDSQFNAARVADITPDDETAKALSRISPLSGEVALRLIRQVRGLDGIHAALEHEYRATHRCIEHGDLIEGIRAQVIDKDRTPNWRHASFAQVPDPLIDAFLAPIGTGDLP